MRNSTFFFQKYYVLLQFLGVLHIFFLFLYFLFLNKRLIFYVSKTGLRVRCSVRRIHGKSLLEANFIVLTSLRFNYNNATAAPYVFPYVFYLARLTPLRRKQLITYAFTRPSFLYKYEIPDNKIIP